MFRCNHHHQGAYYVYLSFAKVISYIAAFVFNNFSLVFL